jgi:hypothetical protein
MVLSFKQVKSKIAPELQISQLKRTIERGMSSANICIVKSLFMCNLVHKRDLGRDST